MTSPPRSPRAAGPTGVIVALQVRPERGGATQDSDVLELAPDHGVHGDHGRRARRHITILSEEAWEEAVASIGVPVPWQARRANVLVRGLDLSGSEGRVLELGPCLVRIHGETHPCDVMDRAAPGLRAALVPRWRGGVHGEILRGGALRPGDAARFHDEHPPDARGATPTATHCPSSDGIG